jgi:hypothetical protein
MKFKLFFLFIISGMFSCKSNENSSATTDAKPIETVQPVANNSNPTPNQTTNTGTPTEPATTATTTIQWLDSTYKNLGKLKEGKEVFISYRFKNNGTSNLIIKSVSAQCGCTIPEKPEKPFAPGEEGVIKAKFNGSGSGQIRKEIYVTANTTPTEAITLSFGGEISK